MASKKTCGKCKYKGHCDTTSELYGVPKYNGGCKEYEPKKKEVTDVHRERQ